jgi:hypothetical protein
MGIIKETEDKSLGRRKFLKFGLGFMAGVGLFSAVGGINKLSKDKKIKMLTADGKLVEVDASKIEKEIVSGRASNEELQDWMNTKHK